MNTSRTFARRTHVVLNGLTYRLRNVRTHNEDFLVGEDATGRPQYFRPDAIVAA